jgi:hypothetical protein
MVSATMSNPSIVYSDCVRNACKQNTGLCSLQESCYDTVSIPELSTCELRFQLAPLPVYVLSVDIAIEV